MNLHSTLACAAAMAATIATLAVLAHPIDAARTITIDVDEAPPVAATLLPTLRVSADPSGLTRVELGAEEPLPVVLLPTVQVRASLQRDRPGTSRAAVRLAALPAQGGMRADRAN
ncbi:MAG: hypothetical protein DWB45_10535 [Xanthomonadales bacterium]|nr:hypothetical protein [Xanthomonadales bacterium]MDL1868712.1 hypothetical protein [Gammaproteobacteria bacterium PRO6]